jgi:hypothetical protein
MGRGTASLDAERPLRTATPGGYDPTRPQDTYLTTSLPAIFDGVVHYPVTTASDLIVRDTVLRIAGSPITVASGCQAGDDVSAVLVLDLADGSVLTVAPHDTSAAAVSLVRDGTQYAGDVVVDLVNGFEGGSSGFTLEGTLWSSEDAAVAVEAALPWSIAPAPCPRAPH